MNLKILSLDTKKKFLLILIIAIYLRMINITSEQIWADEAISINIASSLITNFWKLVINDIHPPLYYLILKGWITLFGTSVFAARSLSVIFSVLTIPFIFLIGRNIKNNQAGLIVSLLYSISPFSIYYANEVRSYSLLIFLFSIGFYLSIKCIKKPNDIKYYLFLGAIGSALIYTHYIGIVYIGVLYLSIFFIEYRNKMYYRNIIPAILINILLYIPWIPYALEDALGGAHGYTGGVLNALNLVYYAFTYFLAPVPSKINNPYVLNIIIETFILNIPFLVIMIISLTGFLYSFKKYYYYKRKNEINFIIILIVLFFGIPFHLVL